MALTHVCKWDGTGWKPITAQEVQRESPGESISEKSGLFMCELCGQYVRWNHRTTYIEHFKHSGEEKSKDCPEHSQAVKTVQLFEAREYNLPIRMMIRSEKRFKIEIGLFDIPENPIEPGCTIRIEVANQNVKPFKFSAQRIQPNGITYLSLADAVAAEYRISVYQEKEKIECPWPVRVTGISQDGALFDQTTGKKLPIDADVQIEHPYYLLTRRPTLRTCDGIESERVCAMRSQSGSWYVFKVCAHEFSQNSAEFFLDYHARLTDTPLSMRPVWPPHVSTPYIIHSYESDMHFFVRSNNPRVLNVSTYPFRSTRRTICAGGTAVRMDCSGRQQIVSFGRTKMLRYTYIWQQELKETADLPAVEVVDEKNNAMQPRI